MLMCWESKNQLGFFYRSYYFSFDSNFIAYDFPQKSEIIRKTAKLVSTVSFDSLKKQTAKLEFQLKYYRKLIVAVW